MEISIKYTLHIQDAGWKFGWGQNGVAVGTVGLGKRAECVKFDIDGLPEGSRLQYHAHVSDIGWMPWVDLGSEAGTTGQGRRLESIEFRWLNNPKNCSIIGRCHVSDVGWQFLNDRNNLTFGTTGLGHQIEAVQFCIVQETVDNKVLNAQIADLVNLTKSQLWDKIKEDVGFIMNTNGCLASLNRAIILCEAPVPYTCEAAGMILAFQCASAVNLGEKIFNAGGGDHGNNNANGETHGGNAHGGDGANNDRGVHIEISRGGPHGP